MKPTSAARLLSAFDGKRVLVAGDLMLDRYWRGEVERISPEAPVPVVRKTSAYAVPGGAANTARNVTALGAQAILLGTAGRDEAGAELCRILTEGGIDCSRISVAAGRPTTVKLRVIAHDQQVVRVDEEETTALDGSLAAQVVKRARLLIPRVDAVVISDYAKGFVSTEVARGLVEAARRAGKPVVVDPKGTDCVRYRGVTLIKPNRNELAALTGLAVRNHDETMVAGQELLRRMGGAAVVVTEGKDGMTLLQPGGAARHFPSFAREIYDVTGAGDTALAMLAVALAAGAQLDDAVWLSNLAAGLAVGESGTVAIAREQVANALAAMKRAARA